MHVFSELHKKFNGLELHIIGEGPEKPGIAEVIKNLKLESNIFLTGFLHNPFELIASCDLSVLSSNSEGFPNVVLEAMALGLPVVAADCPTGPAEIIKSNEFGLLLPVLNSKSRHTWVESMTNLLNHPELLMQLHKQSLLRASDFSEASIMSQWKKTLGI